MSCKYLSDIFISFCIWTINSERLSRYLYRIKKIKIKEIDKSQLNFYLFTYVILVHLLIKDIFILTRSNTLRIIHNSLFLFSKFTYKVGYIKMAGKPQKLPSQWFFFLIYYLLPLFLNSCQILSKNSYGVKFYYISSIFSIFSKPYKFLIFISS